MKENGNPVVEQIIREGTLRAIKHLVDDSIAAHNIEFTDKLIELSECPCDPRRRHERLGQKVAVV